MAAQRSCCSGQDSSCAEWQEPGLEVGRVAWGRGGGPGLGCGGRLCPLGVWHQQGLERVQVSVGPKLGAGAQPFPLGVWRKGATPQPHASLVSIATPWSP